MVGLGIVGGLDGGHETVGTSTAAPTASPDLVGQVIVLQDPPRDGAIVTTRDLVVAGHVPAGTGLRIGLGSANGKALAFASVAPRLEDSGAVGFSVGLPLSNPRPGGTMTVQVIAYDVDGVPIDVVRRTFQVGPVVRTVGGEDGLMGGLAAH